MDKYLLEILKEVNTIIIPGLGALTITDTDKGDIMFMPYLKHDDGELSKYIANKEGLEVNEATNLIAKYVREILNTLDKGESYDMYLFGSFVKDDSGEIVFQSWDSEKKEETTTPVTSSSTEESKDAKEVEQKREHVKHVEEKEDVIENIYTPPTKEGNELKDNSESVLTPEITSQKENPTPKPETDKTVERELNILEKEERAATQSKLDKLREQQNKPQKKRRGPVFYLLIFIGLIVTAFSSYLVIDFEGAAKMMPFLASKTESLDNHNKEEVENDVSEDEASSEEPAGNLEEDSADTSQADKPATEQQTMVEPHVEVKTEETANLPPVPTNSQTGYHIIVGSFGNPDNAERLAAKLRSEGTQASLIKENGYHKVSLGSFNSRAEAKTALNAMNLSMSAIIHKID